MLDRIDVGGDGVNVSKHVIGGGADDLNAGRGSMQEGAWFFDVQSDFGCMEDENADFGEAFGECLEASIAMVGAVCFELLDEDTVMDTMRQMIRFASHRDVGVNASIDGDGLSLDAFPVIDADNHSHLELLDDNDIRKR